MTPDTVTDQKITDCLIMAKSQTYCTSIRVKNLAKELLPDFIITNDKFFTAMVKVKTEVIDIGLREYFDSLLRLEKTT